MFLSETTRPIRTCAVYAEEREYTSLINIHSAANTLGKI